jgi:5-carboxymethyl-2-hydroxymuconate isomerase
MPHITIECSAGSSRRIDVDALAKVVHRTARRSGLFAPNVVRTFAREADFSCVADEAEDNCFVQIIVRMAPGRIREIRKEIAQLVFTAAASAVAEELERGRLGLRVDITESDPELSVSRNTLPL